MAAPLGTDGLFVKVSHVTTIASLASDQTDANYHVDTVSIGAASKQEDRHAQDEQS
jgi:hypothetical protein